MFNIGIFLVAQQPCPTLHQYSFYITCSCQLQLPSRKFNVTVSVKFYTLMLLLVMTAMVTQTKVNATTLLNRSYSNQLWLPRPKFNLTACVQIYILLLVNLSFLFIKFLYIYIFLYLFSNFCSCSSALTSPLQYDVSVICVVC